MVHKHFLFKKQIRHSEKNKLPSLLKINIGTVLQLEINIWKDINAVFMLYIVYRDMDVNPDYHSEGSTLGSIMPRYRPYFFSFISN